MIPYKFKYIIQLFRDQISVVISIGLLAIIVLSSLYTIKVFLDQQTQLQSLRSETADTKERVLVLQHSKKLIENDLDEINELLSLLIPDKEDFFTIINALEQISADSRFRIEQYTLNLQSSTNDKIQIDVEGSGDTASFINFLKTYSFSGGRFITSEKIEYSGAQLTNTKIKLTFYNKKIEIDNSAVPELTEKDIAFLNKIKSKISVNLINEDEKNSSASAGYEIKSNPF